jgi:hypothetical protein
VNDSPLRVTCLAGVPDLIDHNACFRRFAGVFLRI